MHSGRKFLWIGLGLALLSPILLLTSPGMWDISHRSTRYQLEAFGASIYEFHDLTGRWPTQPDDLARTSLPLKSRYWRLMLQNGNIVPVWHDNLSVQRQQNGKVVLAYYNRGLISAFGRKWVCWGDLRTEYISTSRLQAALSAR